MRVQNINDIEPKEPDQGFQFPGAFEITALGHADADLESRVPQIIDGLGLNVMAGSLRSKPSREGNYHSVSLTFTCPDRETYDAVHAALRAEPGIRWTI